MVACHRSEWIEAIVISLSRDPSVAQLEHDGKVRTHLAPRGNIPPIDRECTDPQDLEYDNVAVREGVLYLIALFPQHFLAPQRPFEHLGAPAARAGGYEAVGELDLLDVGREEYRQVVANRARFNGRQIAPRHFEIRQRHGR